MLASVFSKKSVLARLGPADGPALNDQRVKAEVPCAPVCEKVLQGFFDGTKRDLVPGDVGFVKQRRFLGFSAGRKFGTRAIPFTATVL